MVLSSPENLINSYKEVTTPISGYQGQSKGPRFA